MRTEEDMSEGEQNGRRYPRNLQGVLQMAVDAGPAAEAQAPTPVQPMSEEVNLLV